MPVIEPHYPESSPDPGFQGGALVLSRLSISSLDLSVALHRLCLNGLSKTTGWPCLYLISGRVSIFIWSGAQCLYYQAPRTLSTMSLGGLIIGLVSPVSLFNGTIGTRSI